MVMVYGLANSFNPFAAVSAVRSPFILRMMFPDTNFALISANAPPAFVSEV